MNGEYENALAEARAMIAEAERLNKNGQHGAAMKNAYHASEHIAAAYLLAVIGQRQPPNNETFDLFTKTIREPNRYPNKLQIIREVIGDVCVLREVYEPSLLDETTAKDAQQMITRTVALAGLVERI